MQLLLSDMSKTASGQRWPALLSRGFSLSAQFAIAGGVVAIIAMLAVGAWVSNRVASDVLTNAATSTARFMDSFIAPLVQELENGQSLSIGPIRALDEMLDSPELRGRVVSIKLWTPDGKVLYAGDVDLIGKQFAPSPSLHAAAAGRTVAELDSLDDAESEHEAAAGIPLLEIYSPIRADWTGKIIAVGEFYEDASALERQLDEARLQSWLVTSGATALICVALFAIVYRGDRLIAWQRGALAMRVDELEKMAEQNRSLRERAERASRRVAVLNEQNLRLVGADLHDGPVQLIGFATLRLDGLRRLADPGLEPRFREVAEALQSALSEIRELSRGLVLPELADLPLVQAIERAIASHEARSKTAVGRKLGLAEETASNAVKICTYRVVQEGLNNALRHAGGEGQEVEAAVEAGRLRMFVRNRVAAAAAPPHGLGLGGLRDRVESLGGTLRFTIEGGTAELFMELELEREAADE